MSTHSDILLGRIAVERGLLSSDQLASALTEQLQGEAGPLGTILVRKGLVKAGDLEGLLEEQKKRLAHALELSDPKLEDALLGRLLIKQGLAKETQIYECLRAQAEAGEKGEKAPRLGEMLVRKGFLSTDAVDTVLLLQKKKILLCPSCGARFSAQGTESAKKYTCKECGCVLARQEETMLAGQTTGAVRIDVPDDAAEASKDSTRKFSDGKYILIREVGRGGMGVVWKAWQTDLKRYVAIKLLVGTMWTDVELKRFYREAQMAASLSHTNIGSIFEVGSHEGKHFIAMEFVDGESLAQMMAPPASAKATARTMKHFAPRRAIEIVRDAALAVDYAHSKRIIHRDLKPHNIMVEKADGRVYVMDFGLAKPIRSQESITVSDAIVGTPQYMSPEQARGDVLDRRSDVYALGAVLYHCLTGRPPFEGRSPAETMMSVLADDPVPPRRLNARLHTDVETICLKALDKDRHRRYDSARSFAEDLTRYLEGEPISARPLSARERLWKGLKKRPLAAGLGLASLGAAILLGVALLAMGWQETARIEAFYDQAKAAFTKDDYDHAQMYVERALELDPGHFNALELKGACERRKARRAAEADRDRRRDEAEIQRLLSLADRHFDLKNWDKAQDYYVQVLYLDKNHQHAKTRAEICETEDANERQAEKEAARAKEKSDSELRKLQTENAERLKRRERAMPLYDRARRAMDAAARMRIDEGGRYTVSQVLDKYREAREALTQARSEDDSYTEAWYFRGEVRHKMGQYELAELDFQEALKKDPDFAPAAFGSLMNQLSLYMMHAHTPYVQDAKARADAQARLVESPAAQTARRSRDNFERLCAQAVELFQQRNFTAAADRVGASGTEGTGNFFRHFILACVHLEGDKPTEALKELHASLELDPVSLEALFLDALVKYRRGDLEGARRSAEKAMEGSPQENWNVYLLRASIYEKLEMKDEAVKDIEKAAEINKDLAPLIRRKVDVVRKGT